jgi:hypothetical protein
MKKFLVIFVGLIMIAPVARANGGNEGGQQTPVNNYPSDTLVTASYVKGAYDAIDTSIGTLADLNTTTKTTVVAAVNEVNTNKQEKLTSTNVTSTTTSGTSGAIVTAVTANNGAVSVTKGDVTVPVGSYASPTSRANIWIQ